MGLLCWRRDVGRGAHYHTRGAVEKPCAPSAAGAGAAHFHARPGIRTGVQVGASTSIEARAPMAKRREQVLRAAEPGGSSRAAKPLGSGAAARET